MPTPRHSLAFALSIAMLTSVQPSAAQTWGSAGVQVTTLPSAFNLVGYSYGMNESGHVVGWAPDPVLGESRTAIFDGTGLTFLGSTGFAVGTAINDAEDVAGTIRISGTPRAMFHDGTSATLLPTLGIGPYSEGFAVNDAGHVVGYAWGGTDGYHPFFWDGNTVVDLGSFGGNHNIAWGINNHDQIVGTSTTTAGARRAFVYENGLMTDLGTLGGTAAEARSVNDDGQIVGYATTSAGLQHAFLYDGSTMTDLGVFGGAWAQSDAFDANGLGQVVGRAMDTDGLFHAALWHDGDIFRLDDLVGGGWSFDVATNITDSGYILAHGRNNGATPEWVILQEQRVPTEVVPEPISLVLLGSGLVGVAGAARRRRRGETPTGKAA